MNNYEKVKEILESEPVPKELEPENIKKMLDEKAPKKKRSSISVVRRIATAAAAVAVIAGGSAIYLSRSSKVHKSDLYMNGASDYNEVYDVFQKANDAMDKKYSGKNAVSSAEESSINNTNEYYYDEQPLNETSETTEIDSNQNANNSQEHDYYKTYNQEEGVFDIAKTDGEYIYYVSTIYENDNDYYPALCAASADDGKFTDYSSLNISDCVESCLEKGTYESISVNEMYIYNDMLAVIGDVNIEYTSNESIVINNAYNTFVAFFTEGTKPELIDVYFQSGLYQDVRLTSDGFMYLFTYYLPLSFNDVKNAEDYESYIPKSGMSDDFSCIAPNNILLPENDVYPSYEINFTVIGSIDLTDYKNPVFCDIKAFPNHYGALYSTENNIYVNIKNKHNYITRIAIDNGIMTPMASRSVDECANSHLNISEYNDYLRIAVTYDIHDDYDNNFIESLFNKAKCKNILYIFDMELNQIGCLKDFSTDEERIFVNFQEDMAYVESYYPNVPLFAIDLSDPANPTILDECKIPRYSSDLWKWSDGLLFEFEAEFNVCGEPTDIKMAMYDNSNPENLQEVGAYTMQNNRYEVFSYIADYNEKALIISPQRNLIAFPVSIIKNDGNDIWKRKTGFEFFSYENGKFIKSGEFLVDTYRNIDNYNCNRALYIDNYMYILSGAKFYSLNMDNYELCDEVVFNSYEPLPYYNYADKPDGAIESNRQPHPNVDSALKMR